MAEAFKVGQKVRVVNDEALKEHGFRKGDFAIVDSLSYAGKFAYIKRPDGSAFTGGWDVSRFEAVPEFVPKFKKGDRLKVVKFCSGFPIGAIVFANADAPNDHGSVSVSKDGLAAASGANSWDVSRFDLAPAPAAPKFKKGQKLLVVDTSPEANGGLQQQRLGSFKNGDIVEASEDSYFPGPGTDEEVRIGGVSWIARRFEAAPEPKPELKLPEPKFRKGQKLRAVEKVYPFLAPGDIALANANSYVGFDGTELVQVTTVSGEDRTFYVSRFEAVPVELKVFAAPPNETYIVFEPDGSSYHTSDLNELDAGERVAVYRLERVGNVKEGQTTIE
jgi:hypothetical protein